MKLRIGLTHSFKIVFFLFFLATLSFFGVIRPLKDLSLQEVSHRSDPKSLAEKRSIAHRARSTYLSDYPTFQNEKGDMVVAEIPYLHLKSQEKSIILYNEMLRHFRSVACPDYSDESSVEDAYEGARGLSADIQKQEAAVGKEYIMIKDKVALVSKYSGFYNEWTATTTLISPSLVSFRTNFYAHCAQMYDNAGSEGYVYDLSKLGNLDNDGSIERLSFESLLRDENNAKYQAALTIKSSYIAQAFSKEKVTDDLALCQDGIEGMFDDILRGESAQSLPDRQSRLKDFLQDISFTLTPKGVEIVSFHLPHALKTCDADYVRPFVLVPYEKLSQYMKTEYISELMTKH